MLQISRLRKFFSQSPFQIGDRNGTQENNDSSVRSTTDVNAEYEKTFRTKSYLEMYKRFKTKTPSVKSLSSPPLSPSRSISFHRIISTQNSFKSHHETLIDSVLQNPNLNQVLVNYFETSYKAREKCESLLLDVFQIKANHHVITNILKSFKHGGLATILPELLKPFTAVTLQEFSELHETHRNLYRDLTSQRRKTKKRTKLRKYIKRAAVSILVVGGSTLAAVLIVLFAHSVIAGVVAAPGLLVLCSLVIFLIKKLKKKSSTASASKGLIEQLDAAARGVFMIINDFDSLGKQVARLNIDIESQERGFAGDHSDDEFMMNELVKKFQIQEARFVEELEELGKQAVLCLLDIKRSRNQVVEEISVA